ncbi:SDR family oxidoreductase [Pedobacter petrophilus]|uniref:SDR family oxidoreductase n=1 Tax=Pedobacter petrophilus TaxID=1908241 RepID=UPI001FD725AC|nr:SDR family oxidoreductase [Pedobacter petrophilus]
MVGGTSDKQIIAVNVRDVYVAALVAVKHLPVGVRIISISGNMANNAGESQATLYVMSKSALQGFTRGLACGLGSINITVNVCSPDQ